MQLKRQRIGCVNGYKQQVSSEHGIFNVRGLGLVNTYTLNLDHVFIELRIDPSNPQKFNLDPIAQRKFAGNRPVWDFVCLEKTRTEEAFALAVVGPPGSGKTTLLQNIALTFAKNRQRRYRMRAFTPVLLFLRNHTQTITQAEPPPLSKLAHDYFSNKDEFPTLKPPHGWFERELGKGKCIVLLDGLDEVADVEQRKAVSAWVDNQIKNYTRCCFVLTARPQGYKDAALQRASVLEVLPFNTSQMQRFVEAWYLANEIKASGNSYNADVKRRAGQDAKDLLRRLYDHTNILALAINPLLLTMIAMVHRYHGALPRTRVELYAEICEVLLGRWRQAKGVQDKLTSAQKLVVLRPLAAYMMEHKKRDVDVEKMLPLITEPLASIGITSDEVKDFPREIQDSSGLLLEREAGQWGFAHLSWVKIFFNDDRSID